MTDKNIYAVYFSPTGGTKKYVLAAAAMLGEKYKEIDLTDLDKRRKSYTLGENDLAIIGAPVYFGRVAQIENGIFDRLKGMGTKAILFSVYGNRDYDDALLELKQITSENGFKTIGAAALIAPHSFCEKAGLGRPNGKDLSALADFMGKIKLKLTDEQALDKEVFIKGHYPFKPYGKIPFYPTADGKCDKCRICFQICPANAINAANPRNTDPDKCISCMACVKACPQKARGFHSVKAKMIFKMFERKLLKTNKEAEFFL